MFPRSRKYFMKFFPLTLRRHGGAACSLLLATLLPAFGAHAQPVATSRRAPVTAAPLDMTVGAQVALNFTNTDIALVAKALGDALGQTILVDPRVKGQLTLVAEHPVPQAQALKTLEAALRMQGYALLDDHGVLKVVPESDAKLQGVAAYVGNQPVAHGEQIITQVFQLHHSSAQSLLPVLRPLISQNNQIAAYAANNSLVVTDYADNVGRIATIVAGIEGDDGSVRRGAAVVPVLNANVLDLAPMLQKLLDASNIGDADATMKVDVIADPRTNSIGLRASDPSRIALARALITQLDQATQAPGNIHVVSLKNADALKLARILRALMGDSSGDSDSGGGMSGRGGLGRGSASSSSSSNSSNGGGSGGSGSSGFGGSGGGGSASSFGSGSGGGIPPLPGGGHGLGGDMSSGSGEDDQDGSGNTNTMVQADPATNSLIIVAAEPVYRNLRTVIDQLDVRRAQIYLEALILEVSAEKAESLGVQWQGMLSSGGNINSVFAGTNFNNGNGANIVSQSIGTRATGGLIPKAAASMQNGINVGWMHQYGNGQTLGALLQAVDNNSDVKVLSTPNLITLDNEEAQILVGQNVPVPTGTAAAAPGVQQFNSYGRQNVGISLHVRPQITEDGVIKLVIYQEDSAVDHSVPPPSDGSGPTFDTRSIRSTVLADNGEIIVLGGLIQDNYSSTQSKVPGLGDLPWIGGLFRYETKTRDRSNLMVFLRPVILPDAHTSQTVSLNRYNEMRALTDNYQSPNHTVRDLDTPVLPPAPPGPDAGVPAEQGLFDLRQMQRGGKGSSAGQSAVPATLSPSAPAAPTLSSPSAPILLAPAAATSSVSLATPTGSEQTPSQPAKAPGSEG